MVAGRSSRFADCTCGICLAGKKRALEVPHGGKLEAAPAHGELQRESGDRRSDLARRKISGVHRFQRIPSEAAGDRKSTRLNSSHQIISYAVFCLKKKKQSSLQVQLSRCSQLHQVELNSGYA